MPRPRYAETSPGQLAAKHSFNAGLIGKPRPAADTTVIPACIVGTCGTPASDRRPPKPHMVRVSGAADGAASHWYCPERCAAIARARAELRAVPMRPGGER